MHRWWISAALAVMTLIALTAFSVQTTHRAAAAVVPLPVAGTFDQWAPMSQATDQTVTLAQATAIAQQYNVVTVVAAKFRPYVSAMHSANPALKLLVYENAAFSGSATQFPASWYEHTASGALVQSVQYSRYMMDMTNQSWLQSVGQSCANAVAAYGFDGCYFDLLNTAPMLPGFLTGTPIDSQTGAPWTTPDYVTALVNAVPVLRAANPGVPVVGNTLGTGFSYFKTDGTSVRPVLDELDGGHAEDFLRSATEPLTQYPNVNTWLGSVNMLADAGSRGDSVLAQTKLWVTASASQTTSWYRYAAATFLLGTSGTSYFNFAPAQTVAGLTYQPYGQINVGTPIGSYFLAEGVYQRRYTDGLIVVNPGTTQATFALPAGTWTTLEGVTEGSQMTLAPDSGDVLHASQPWGNVPVVTVAAPTSITPTSAVIPVTVNGEGQQGTARIDYGSSPALGSASATVTTAAGTSTVKITVTGLASGTTYSFQAEATTGAGSAASATMSFTTPLAPPRS